MLFNTLSVSLPSWNNILQLVISGVIVYYYYYTGSGMGMNKSAYNSASTVGGCFHHSFGIWILPSGIAEYGAIE